MTGNSEGTCLKLALMGQAECVPRVRRPIDASRKHSNQRCRVNAHKDFHRHRSRVVGFSPRSNGKKVRTPSSTRECSTGSEKEVLEAFERIIHDDSPTLSALAVQEMRPC